MKAPPEVLKETETRHSFRNELSACFWWSLEWNFKVEYWH